MWRRETSRFMKTLSYAWACGRVEERQRDREAETHTRRETGKQEGHLSIWGKGENAQREQELEVNWGSSGMVHARICTLAFSYPLRSKTGELWMEATRGLVAQPCMHACIRTCTHAYIYVLPPASPLRLLPSASSLPPALPCMQLRPGLGDEFAESTRWCV